MRIWCSALHKLICSGVLLRTEMKQCYTVSRVVACSRFVTSVVEVRLTKRCLHVEECQSRWTLLKVLHEHASMNEDRMKGKKRKRCRAKKTPPLLPATSVISLSCKHEQQSYVHSPS